MMPMPTPAPTAPSPPPTPRPIDLPALAMFPVRPPVAARNVMTLWNKVPPPVGLMALGDRAAEVDRGERREDERLQRRDEPHLEDEQHDARGQREPGDRRDAEEHRERAG